jgi:hypothetical protein
MAREVSEDLVCGRDFSEAASSVASILVGARALHSSLGAVGGQLSPPKIPRAGGSSQEEGAGETGREGRC